MNRRNFFSRVVALPAALVRALTNPAPSEWRYWLKSRGNFSWVGNQRTLVQLNSDLKNFQMVTEAEFAPKQT